MSQALTCIVLDDEPLAVALLKDHIQKCPQLQLLHASTNAAEAMFFLQKQTVDLVFIDIQMPEINGLEFIQLFNQKTNFIITSAYQKHALTAFEFSVIDYLLKPISFTRFYQSIEKFLQWKLQFQEQTTGGMLRVKADRKIYQIPFEDILFIEGAKDYAKIHTEKEKFLVLETMKELEDKLPNSSFMRTHRSFIVAINKINWVEGNYLCIQKNNNIPIGETYKEQVLTKLKSH